MLAEFVDRHPAAKLPTALDGRAGIELVLNMAARIDVGLVPPTPEIWSEPLATRTGRSKFGVDEWWQAVTDTRTANSEHMAEEERQALADFRRNTDPDSRNKLGAAFASYETSNACAEDHDPDRYVKQHS